MPKSVSCHGTMSEPEYYFVTNSSSGGGRDEQALSKCRSHAVKRALHQQRLQREQQLDNFRVITAVPPIRKDGSARRRPKKDQRAEGSSQRGSVATAAPPSQTSRSRVVLSPGRPISPNVLDPFGTLAVDSARLQFFLRQEIAQQATEPICSVGDLAFQNFRRIFRCGFEDPALLNAIMLAMALAHSGSVDRECLEYQSKALTFVGRQIHSPERGTREATMGAILLLAGVDARLGNRAQVEVHMRGLHDLLSSCVASATVLSHGIKRAIFWQDLNASIMTGSKRYTDHETFAELFWRRDPLLPSIYTFPPGFSVIRHLMSEGLITTFEDILGLQLLREHADGPEPWDVVAFMHIDNAQAWIESRLWQRTPSERTTLLDCCRLAAYLCTFWLFVEIWGGVTSSVSTHVSTQLAQKLQQASDWPVCLDWEGRHELLAWVLFVGGCFSPNSLLRSEYTALLHGTYSDILQPWFRDWEALLQVLQRFIWSQKVFGSRAQVFWEECRLA